MRIAFVVQRYGTEISGGAELHCRWIVEKLLPYYQIEVLTTRAMDYLTWKNQYPKGTCIINGVPVKRFNIRKTRDPYRFGNIQHYIFNNPHTIEDELVWLKEEGPCSPALLRYIKKRQKLYDYFIFFSYRYYQSYHGINLVPQKSILVPTAERDPVVKLKIFKELFNKPRAFIYNSVEERLMINDVSNNEDILGDVVGVGIDIPDKLSADDFRKKYHIKDKFILYIGRIDENKGFPHLFNFFIKFLQETNKKLSLVLIGENIIDIPDHPGILHLGVLSDRDKCSALLASELLVMPSFLESLSMVLLEAWAMERAVLVNANCDVLKGQCIRSNGGLYYRNYDEFTAALSFLSENHRIRKAMAQNGKKYFDQNYRWEVIIDKYRRIISLLEKQKGAKNNRAKA
jgi:glycosyltransferase involved in cell wall biosynthesis